MRYNQLLLILILTLLVNGVNAQAFKNDWAKFESTRYTVKVSPKSSVYLNTKTLGEIYFYSKSDSTEAVALLVFPRAVIDDENFTKKSSDLAKKSCVRLQGEEVVAFVAPDYYYLLSPSQNCETPRKKEFESLAKEIFDWIMYGKEQ